jgi:hypothetical protein
MSDAPANEIRVSCQFGIGWDPAKQKDYSAISVLERVNFVWSVLEQRGFEPPMLVDKSREEYHVRHLQRLKRGTNFVDQVDIVAALYRALPPAKEAPALCMDLGGLGRPLYDLAKKRHGLAPYGILITGGFAESRPSRLEYHVPRKVLLSNLAVLLQNDILKISPGLAEGETLVTELSNVRLRAFAESDDSNVTDDLAFSVAYPAYFMTRRPKPLRVVQGTAFMGR